MFSARILPSLPLYGPAALSFPRPDAISEGFVVEFTTEQGEKWVGNFDKWDDRKSLVLTDLGPTATVIVAGGAGYIVDTGKRQVTRELGPSLERVWFVSEIRAVVALNGLWCEAFDANRTIWTTHRFSGDGIRNICQSGTIVRGDAFELHTHRWIPFRLDLATGEVQGGSGNGPD